MYFLQFFYYIFSVKNFFGPSKQFVKKYLYNFFLFFTYFFRINTFKWSRVHMKKSGVEKFFLGPFLNKVNFFKVSWGAWKNWFRDLRFFTHYYLIKGQLFFTITRPNSKKVTKRSTLVFSQRTQHKYRSRRCLHCESQPVPSPLLWLV